VFRAAEVIAAMSEFISIKNEISIDGGVTANPYFCQFLADVLNRRIIAQSLAELTAFGTAKLTAGNNIDQKMRDSLARQYQPETDRRQYLEKFKDAVTRSIEWRS